MKHAIFISRVSNKALVLPICLFRSGHIRWRLSLTLNQGHCSCVLCAHNLYASWIATCLFIYVCQESWSWYSMVQWMTSLYYRTSHCVIRIDLSSRTDGLSPMIWCHSLFNIFISATSRLLGKSDSLDDDQSPKHYPLHSIPLQARVEPSLLPDFPILGAGVTTSATGRDGNRAGDKKCDDSSHNVNEPSSVYTPLLSDMLTNRLALSSPQAPAYGSGQMQLQENIRRASQQNRRSAITDPNTVVVQSMNSLGVRLRSSPVDETDERANDSFPHIEEYPEADDFHHIDPPRLSLGSTGRIDTNWDLYCVCVCVCVYVCLYVCIFSNFSFWKRYQRRDIPFHICAPYPSISLCVRYDMCLCVHACLWMS